MSQVKLILRPPPNVDFVHGYPGIPPGGPDRPQAAVKGTVEVRAGPQGAKAKWVRIELRKVETLPGGGDSNTFYDHVGPSPVNLWQSNEEFGLLRSHDFPFSIRIPESIPPSVALEGRAGIQYELVASLCTQGKKGFFRKRKSVVVSTSAPVIIDKHDLHSTWPVYLQPDTRQTIQNGVTLVLNRNKNCFGPGDRISVMAHLKSDTLSDTILRGFELTLRECTRFNLGAQPGKKGPQSQEKNVILCDSKLAINGTLFPGQEYRGELTCALSENHTTTTLNSARHIDVNYTLFVRAIIDGIPPVEYELPVVISNWQRVVSLEAVKRIGPTPGLSLVPVQPVYQAITRSDPRSSPAAATLPLSKDNYGRVSPAPNFNSLPGKTGYHGSNKVDEMGGYGFSTNLTHGHDESVSSADEFISRPPAPTSNAISGNGRTPGGSTGPNPVKRLTVTNVPTETSQPDGNYQRAGSNANTSNTATPAATTALNAVNTGSVGGSASGTANRAWMTAEEEKQRLYEIARAKAERAQGLTIARTQTPPPQQTMPPASPPQPTQPAASPPRPWLTAEEEKTRLFNKAQAAVLKKTQGIDVDSNSVSPSMHARSDSDGSRGADLSRQASTSKVPLPGRKNTAAELYSEAMAARDRAIAREQSTTASSQRQPARAPVPQYLTAEQEKAALKRYHAAKEAVDRVQNSEYPAAEDAGSLQSGSGPVAYDALYPDTKGASSSAPPSAPENDLPPSFDSIPANLIPMSHLSEKERLRRAYEEQDAAAQRQQTPPAPASPPPFSQAAPSPAAVPNALQEKEMLRRKFEAQDAQAMNVAAPVYPQPPPRSNSVNTSSTAPVYSLQTPPRSNSVNTTTSRTPSAGARGPRPAPTPPSSPGRVLTAAEEKALLRAKYAAQEARAQQQQQQQSSYENGVGSSQPTSSTAMAPSTPPPLLPRPPAEYIQETQEEDARVSRFAMNSNIPIDDHHDHLMPYKLPNGSSHALDVRPISPFSAGFDSIPPPPPLPPKPVGE
ncbi:hypothetical protein H0H92_003211 [Tricholoma furcatifolium]|nr:hypothetical protein H0H92_003211 [Tricholoma furcatifolium]